MSAYLTGALWLIGAWAVGTTLVLLMRRFWPGSHESVSQDVISVLFSMTATLYAIVAALVFIDVWQVTNDARTATFREAQAVQSVSWAATRLPDDVQAKVNSECREYLKIVTDDEWPKLRAGEQVGTEGWTVLNRLQELATTDQAVAKDEDAGPALESSLSALAEARQDRLGLADRRIGGVTWFALIIGAILAFLTMLFFPFNSTFVQLLLTATVTGVMTLLLFTIHELEHPFQSSGRVPVTVYQDVATRLPLS